MARQWHQRLWLQDAVNGICPVRHDSWIDADNKFECGVGNQGKKVPESEKANLIKRVMKVYRDSEIDNGLAAVSGLVNTGSGWWYGWGNIPGGGPHFQMMGNWEGGGKYTYMDALNYTQGLHGLPAIQMVDSGKVTKQGKKVEYASWCADQYLIAVVCHPYHWQV